MTAGVPRMKLPDPSPMGNERAAWRSVRIQAG